MVSGVHFAAPIISMFLCVSAVKQAGTGRSASASVTVGRRVQTYWFLRHIDGWVAYWLWIEAMRFFHDLALTTNPIFFNFQD